jgi:hypothetical protein
VIVMWISWIRRSRGLPVPLSLISTQVAANLFPSLGDTFSDPLAVCPMRQFLLSIELSLTLNQVGVNTTQFSSIVGETFRTFGRP